TQPGIRRQGARRATCPRDARRRVRHVPLSAPRAPVLLGPDGPTGAGRRRADPAGLDRTAHVRRGRGSGMARARGWGRGVAGRRRGACGRPLDLGARSRGTTMSDRPDLSIVLPVYNEADSLGPLWTELL